MVTAIRGQRTDFTRCRRNKTPEIKTAYDANSKTTDIVKRLL